MGILSFLFGDSGGSSHNDDVKIEGRRSQDHTHSDGTRGHDIYAARVSCRDGECTEKNAGWGHISVREDGSRTGHVK
jgi:hypothetical protein